MLEFKTIEYFDIALKNIQKNIKQEIDFSNIHSLEIKLERSQKYKILDNFLKKVLNPAGKNNLNTTLQKEIENEMKDYSSSESQKCS